MRIDYRPGRTGAQFFIDGQPISGVAAFRIVQRAGQPPKVLFELVGLELEDVSLDHDLADLPPLYPEVAGALVALGWTPPAAK